MRYFFSLQNWNESTNPEKFVHEDLAIASYLIILWEQADNNCSRKKASFVDLGCGNGLLVYILNGEGHPGYGIDLRKRKIWESLGCDLRVRATVICSHGVGTKNYCSTITAMLNLVLG